jgi:hypothetical protein
MTETPHSEFFTEILNEVATKLDDLAVWLRSAQQRQSERISRYQHLLVTINGKLADDRLKQFNPIQFLEHSYSTGVEKGGLRAVQLKEFSHWYRDLRAAFYAQLSQRNSYLLSLSKQTQIQDFLAELAEREAQIQEYADRLHHYAIPSAENCVDASNQPLFTIYEHNFDARYFGSHVRPVNSDYLSRLFTRLLSKPSLSDLTTFLQSCITETDGQIARLVELRGEAIESLDGLRLVEKFPDSSIVQSSPAFGELRSFANTMRTRLKRLERSAGAFPTACRQIHSCASELSLLIQSFDHKLGRYHAKFVGLDSMNNSIGLQYRIFAFLKQVTTTTAIPPITKVHTLYQQFVNAERAVRDRIARCELKRHAVEQLCADLSQLLHLLDKLSTEADLAAAARDRLYQKISTTCKRKSQVSQPKVSLRGDLQDHRRALSELAATVRAVTATRSQQFAVAKQQILMLLDEFGRINRFSPLKEVADLIGASPVPVIEWKGHIRRYLADLEGEKTQELAKLRARVDDVRAMIRTAADQQEEQVLWEIPKEDVAFAVLRAQLACPVCEREVTKCLSPCGHAFCDQCVKIVGQSGKCPSCGTKFGSNDIIDIRWEK